MQIGYARVSTLDQTLDQQTDYLSQQGAKIIFKEKISATKDRPELKKCLSMLKAGDTLIVLKLDRLGRSVKDLITIVDTIKSKGANLKTSDGIDTSNAMGIFVFHIFSALAEMELALIKDRTKSGLAAARARGHVGGRPKGLSSTAQLKAEAVRKMYDEGTPIMSICEALSISNGSVFKYLRSTGREPNKKMSMLKSDKS